MGKIFTFLEAKNQLGKFVDNGTCSATIIGQRINEAVQRLIVKPELQDSPRLNYLVRIKSSNREFALPRGVEKIMAVDINGTPGHVFNKMYQFLSSGPGDLDDGNMVLGNCSRHLMDLGEFPFQFQMPVRPGGLNLMAFSMARDTTKLKVWGLDHRNNEISEELTINQFFKGEEGQISGSFTDGSIKLSTNRFIEITRISKSTTSSAIVLYAVEPSTNETWFVAKYHAKDSIPMFRRYRIINKKNATGEDGNERSDTCILAMVKLGYVELSEDDDIVPIDSISALKLMLIAIKYENDGNLNNALQFELNAVRLLEDVNAHHKVSQGTPVIIDFERRLMGGVANRWPYI